MRCAEAMDDLKSITSSLIRHGFSEDQNYPSMKKVGNQFHISFAGFQDISIALKDVAYQEIYHKLDELRQYNVKLLDGALIQIFYCYENDELTKHRLCYFPAPTFESFQNEPELYLDEGNIYADIIQKSILPVPIRFDFAPNDAEPIIHPSSHLTLGQYKNCRIPVTSPLCPSTFVNFILSSFYSTAYLEIPATFSSRRLQKTIHVDELSFLHINV
ncbi:DUF2290 domain-containing protein [Paraglaciecola sp. 2405UD69-4]|uniref:DUF2290 domain-containing protein n=1 Tax=Paraglaciecola sp. 2405UD69-4 TaxID=3391836 RepID=UPI0039C9C77B